MESKEIWKDVPGYEGLYKVSNTGFVISFHRVKERKLKGGLDIAGYKHVGLYCVNKKLKLYKVHQVVAMAFLNHKPCGLLRVVDHIDNDKLNNNLYNLQVISIRENSSKDKPGLIGASWYKRDNKWRSAIAIGGKNYHLGYFETELMANTAYLKKLSLCLT